MNNGFIVLHRKIFEWEWYNDINVFKLFIHLLLSANHEDKTWKGHLIKRGQLITGRIKLSQETGLSQQEIRTCLNKLKLTNELTIKITNKFSILTIENYNTYQQKNNKLTNKLTNRTSADEPTSNHKQQYNNINKENKSASQEQFIQELKTIYKHLDVDVELAKADGWLLKRPDRKKTKSFIINWLNRADAPLENNGLKIPKSL